MSDSALVYQTVTPSKVPESRPPDLYDRLKGGARWGSRRSLVQEPQEPCTHAQCINRHNKLVLEVHETVGMCLLGRPPFLNRGGRAGTSTTARVRCFLHLPTSLSSFLRLATNNNLAYFVFSNNHRSGQGARLPSSHFMVEECQLIL